MLVEDFTHVLPENKPCLEKKKGKVDLSIVYDLAKANRADIFFRYYREQMAEYNKLDYED